MHVLAASPKIMRNRREHASEHGWEHAGSAIVPHQLRNRGNMQKASLGYVCVTVYVLQVHVCVHCVCVCMYVCLCVSSLFASVCVCVCVCM